MKYFSMFSGIGGFELGLQSASNKQLTQIKQDWKGWNGDIDEVEHNVLSTSGFSPLCVGYSEIDKYAIKVYERHFNGHRNYGDATKINPNELPDFDLLVGGFPCQAFSIAGKRKGFDDTRGTLFFDIARILKDKRPRHLVLENVKGLFSHNSGKTFQTILGVLSDLGYGVEWQILNSKDFGVPQNRERIFIIGHLRGECGRKVFPITGNDRKDTAQDKLHDRQQLLERNEPQSVQEEETATNSYRIRRLTPTECERLQGFPDNWTKYGEQPLFNQDTAVELIEISDTQRYKMCGNAVTVNVIEAIMREMCV